MIELHNDTLRIAFPEVHPEARTTISFQRTLRVPDDDRSYPLPAGLGDFPLHAVDDFAVPDPWREHGGVFLPIRQAEALWIALGRSRSRYPMAIKIAAGKVNAVTGAAWDNALHAGPQDYLVVPAQPWLDGFHASEDAVRQFVAMPLGEGCTAEEQLTGEASWGGLQIVAYPMKADEFRRRFERPSVNEAEPVLFSRPRHPLPDRDDMGLAPGGRIRQEIAADPYGIDVWETSVYSRCFVHLLNAERYRAIAGRAPPPTPITPAAYRKAGIPWFEYYQDGETLKGSKVLAGLDSLAARLFKRGRHLPDNAPIEVAATVDLSTRSVRDGNY